MIGNPFHNMDIPIKKRGQPYQMDFLIVEDEKQQQSAISELPITRDRETSTSEASISEASTSEASISKAPNILIFKKNFPLMVIEVKASVPADIAKINSHDLIELLLYCHYFMRLRKLEKILGILTDGETWHTIKLQRIPMSNLLSVKDYAVLCSTDASIIIGNIPKLMELI